MVVRRLVRSLKGRAALSQTVAVPGFDPAFYRLSNPDLQEIADDAALEQHFRLHGRAEGRPGNEAEARAALIEEQGEPPEDFDPGDYLDCNPDLRASLASDWQATEHYMRFGRREKRRTFVLDVELYRDLYFPGQTISDERIREHYDTTGRKAGLIRSPADFMSRRGLPGRGRWITRVDVRDFQSINWPWAKSTVTRLDAIEAMLAEGIGRLAPIASRLVFEPAYQRDIHAGTPVADFDDVALYRRWLFVGFELGERPSGAEHLRDLKLPLSSYPESFDWRAYAARRKLARPSRWTALDDLVAAGALHGVIASAEGGVDAALVTAVGMALAVRADKASVLWLEWARAISAPAHEAMQSLADSYLRLERWDDALAAYGAVARSAGANVWTFVNGARAAIRAETPEAAFGLLQLGHADFSGDCSYRAVVQEVMEADFAKTMKAAQRLYLADERADADALLTSAVPAGADRWRALDPLGEMVAPLPEQRIVVLANIDLRQCTHYRVEQKAQLFEAAGREHQIFQAAHVDGFMAALPGATAAIFYRLAGLPTNVRAIEYARSLGVPTYYEIDDLIFSDAYPDPLESYGGSITPEVYAGLQAGVPLFRAAIQLCDYGIASTAPLAEAMKPLVRTGEVFVLPNGLDGRNEDLAVERPARVRRDDDIVLFYGSGTKAHNSDFLELAGPALAEIMAARSDVRMMIVGYLVLDDRLAAFSDRITAVDFVPDSQSYWSLLAEADVNLAVLAPGVVADAKSEIKWLEAAVLGIPSVVSDTATYRGGLTDGVDVLMVRTAEDWRKALGRLIDDPGLRRSIGERAKTKALSDFSVEANAARLEGLLKPAEARAQSSAAAGDQARRRKRVLVVNVFFPPQTIGGATRVVRDNLDAFLTSPDGGIDYAVVASDHGVAPPYKLRVDTYRDLPVFRISTPQQVNMDWRPLDDAVGDRFAEVLELWQPDLVHFHCVQRLTASVLQVCVEAGVPYLVTLHDAWWISDHQFLVDDKGRIQQPCESVPSAPPAPATVGDSLFRRRALTRLLNGAEAVLAVSRTFADLYRQCGFAQVAAVPNGVSPMQEEARKPSPSGRVRLAHVGGLSAHKGYDLLQAALKASDLANLELTLVDHARSGGAERRELWGATPVRFVGKTSQEQMHVFYAEHDVLLAPSIWPESFGLVAREALAAGLWVVASDRGAMAEDIVQGVNGLIVDVGDPAGLLAALTEIDRDPQRYLAAPPPTALRTAQAQADDLLAIYRDLLAKPRRAPPIPKPPRTKPKSASGPSARSARGRLRDRS